MSSDAISLNKTSKKHKKWFKGKKKSKLVQSDLLQMRESSTTDARDSKISENWKALSQVYSANSTNLCSALGGRQNENSVFHSTDSKSLVRKTDVAV